MLSQKKLIDGIRSFSPEKESWKDKSLGVLPETLIVNFEAGLSGFLDMKNPRDLIWANILDLQRRNNKPVYVEIDAESNVITQLLVPEAARVMSVEGQGEGDVNVLFFTSQARHYLRRENPDFQTMLNALQDAKESKTAILITASRNDYEIIDVSPLPKVDGAETPTPLSPPQPDPAVSSQRAQELFDLMKAKSCDACTASCGSYPHCIPFKHANDGCYARAHEMCRLMMAEGEDPEKVWIYGGLHVVTSNVHHCDINWGWHVAPTLMVTTSGGAPEKYVIDPSLCSAPVTVAAWKGLQGDPAATLEHTSWEPFWSDLTSTDPTFSQTNYYLELKCTYLQLDCVTYGPPPYECPIAKSCHFIVDRSTFSESEIDAMLTIASPAEINDAFYVVVDSFTPEELGITAATLSGVPNIQPTLNISPGIAQMSASVVALDVEDPTHLKRRQRLTWTYKVTFTGTNGFGFAGDTEAVSLSASISTVSNSATLYLIKQPNPYEIDGTTSWLSTDLRVFQIKEGESKFGVSIGSNASAFITQVISNLNSGNSNGQTFENDISLNQQTSRLEISQMVNGTAVYNFAVAKVRYRSQIESATNVRVFFRLIPWATSSVEYDQATAYRRYETASSAIPLLGIKNNQLTSIPCFAAPRINSATTSLTMQSDAPNVLTIPPNPSGSEVVRYFGCWLDINQTTLQFPIQPTPVNGPYISGRVSIQDHIRNEHQCLVSEIAFSHSPIPNGSTPSTSDKLAQRNLAIVDSANPGLDASRRIPQTFEIRPSSSKVDHDELMIDWRDIPMGSVATLYFPDFNTNEIMSLAIKKYRSQRMVRIDQHTLKFDTGGMTYIPIPFTDGTFPGMLTVDLPEGVKKGQVFKVVVRQVTGEPQSPVMNHRMGMQHLGWRHIVGSFQLTIPVHDKADILPTQQRLLSNLRWIERAIPKSDHWSPVFGKYVTQIAKRVDAMGGDSSKVAASPSGQWREAYRRCFTFALGVTLLIALLVVAIGAIKGSLAAVTGMGILALAMGAVYCWINSCRANKCQLLRALSIGTGMGAIVLALLAIFGVSTPQLVSMFIVSAGISMSSAITTWLGRCIK